MSARIVIVGCGFGGLEAARALRGADVQVTLVDRTNHHLFQPLLYQVATAGLSGPAIAAPVRHLFRKQRNVTTLLDEAVRIDPAQRVADRRTHGRRAQARGRDLVEERLEQVVVGAVDERDLDRRLRQRPHRLDAAEAAADDEHARPRRRAHAGLADAVAGSTRRSATR